MNKTINFDQLAGNIIFGKSFSACKWALYNLTDEQKKEFTDFCSSEILYEGHPFEDRHGINVMDEGLEGDSYSMYFLDNMDDFFDFDEYGDLQNLICGND
jgi:hypothetical protein